MQKEKVTWKHKNADVALVCENKQNGKCNKDKE